MMTALEETLSKFISILEELNIDYATIGAIASGIYGLPRTTYDIDVLLNMEKMKIPIFLEELKDKGFTFEKEHILEELEEGYLSEVHYKNIRVDILLTVLPYFKQVIERVLIFNFLDTQIRFATPEDLIILKLLANRDHDKEDVNGIKDIHPELDTAYIKDSLKRLVGEESPSFMAFQQIFASWPF